MGRPPSSTVVVDHGVRVDAGAAAVRPALPRVAVALVVVAGAALRLVVMAGPLGRANADEVLTALMARHIPSDGYPVFVWGQHYGGTAELAPVALSLRLFGWSTTALRLPNLVLAAAISLLVWRLARRVVDRRAAAVAGLLSWVYPGTALWFGLREQLFYPLTVVLGLAFLLLADRLGASRRWIEFAAVGVVAGLGFWTSPFIVYFVVPASAVAAVGLRGRIRHPVDGADRRFLAVGAAVAVAGAVVGALPWLVDNVRTGGASLHAGDAFPVVGTYPERVRYFFADALPGVLGLRRIFTGGWIGGPLGAVVYGVGLAVLALGLVRAARAWRSDGVVPWDGLGLALFPFVFAAFPFVTNDPTYRYAFFAVPFVLVVGSRALPPMANGANRANGANMAAAADDASPEPDGRRRTIGVTVGIAVLVVGIGLSALTIQQLDVVSEVDRAAGIGTLDLAPTLEVLDDRGIDAVFADYWIAYRVTFDTEERVVGAPSAGADRYPPYDEQARASERSAWVVVPGRQQDALTAALAAADIDATVIPAGDLTVVIPSSRVLPEDVPAAARTGSDPS